MEEPINCNKWQKGNAPIAVVMISLNEAHNMEAVLKNLKGFAQEVFLVDSFSVDSTVDIALQNGVHVVQNKFEDFGKQWNFALQRLPITAQWTMKLDPDERLTDELKNEIIVKLNSMDKVGFYLNIRLFFFKKPLPIKLKLLRLWRTGTATMSDVLVNEHIKVVGDVDCMNAEIEHHDSPTLEHWLDKQNRYTTAEAIIAVQKYQLSEQSRFFGSKMQRRMWIKQNFRKIPFRYTLLFMYHYLYQKTYKAGWEGFAWSRLRNDVMRLIEYKCFEIHQTGKMPIKRVKGYGPADNRVKQCE